MMKLKIPGFGLYRFEHLVLDFNGTLAVDGRLQPGVLSKLSQLKSMLQIHILTADTHGSVQNVFGHSHYTIHIINKTDERLAKVEYIRQLNPLACICLGNGNNDVTMLQEAGLSMAILGPEAVAQTACSAAHILVPGIEAALDLLLNPKRLVATLRF